MAAIAEIKMQYVIAECLPMAKCAILSIEPSLYFNIRRRYKQG